MKPYIKKIIKLSMLLISISFFMFNCEHNDENININKSQNTSRYKIKVLNKSQVKSNGVISNKLNRINTKPKDKSNTSLFKEIYNEEYGFTIETDFVKYIIDLETGYHSYIFPLFREIPEDNKLENLVLAYNEEEEYDVYIVKYGFTKDEYGVLSSEELESLDTKYTSIIFDALEFDLSESTKTIYQCDDLWSFELIEDEDENELVGAGNETDPEYGWVLVGISCYYTDDGTGSGPNNAGTYYNPNPNNSGGTPGDTTTPQYPIISTPVALTAQQTRRKDFTQQLSDEQKDCLTGLQNGTQEEQDTSIALFNSLEETLYLDLINILDETYPQDIEDLGEEVLGVICDGGEVDFEEFLILDSDLKNNTCLYTVYTEMGKAPTFANYLNNFDGDMSVANLKLTTSSTLPSSVNAETSTPENYLITITFNDNNLDRPSLSIARTFIHELIHAEMFRKLLSVAQTPNLQSLTPEIVLQLRNDYPGLYDYYIRSINNIPEGMNVTSPQHQAMAQHYRGIIIQALQEYDDSHTDEIYEAFSWVGLQNTIAWNNLTQTERDNIVQTINTFNSNNPDCQ